MDVKIINTSKEGSVEMDSQKLIQLINEARKKVSVGSSKNTAIADHFEALTALHIHENSSAKNNMDKNYQEKIKTLKDRISSNETHLNKEQIEDNIEKSKKSANSYMDSLDRNHGIRKEDIVESHHTPHGISHVIGREVDRKSNPHDLLIKTKTGRYHGSSLKRGSATESNFGVGKISRHHEHEANPKNRILSGLSDIWAKGKKKSKFEKNPDKKGLKLWQARKEVINVHHDTMKDAAEHHASSFNSAEHEVQKKHIKHLLKGDPDVPYDRTSAVTGASIPHNKTRSASTLSKATKFNAESRGNITHFYAVEGDTKHHIASAEHRSTHGPFKSMQVNVKVKETKS